MKKTTQLKNLIQGPKLAFLMEAHNGLSAKIAEEAGFKGLWGSGLSLSASLGLRDNNEASWTQVLEVMEFMSDATTIPILLDGDTGYGNFNNMRRLVQKLEQRGVAGVCIEDKVFPKTNSFLRQGKQPLADKEEFVGKIKAGLDARNDPDFCIVARIEAFIAGQGLSEALKRGHAYAEAGATAILVHSSRKDASEIFAFMEKWDHPCPVVIVPTKYYAVPTEEFKKRKISLVLWANHLLRSSVMAMQKTSREIFQQESLTGIEDKIAPLSEIFRLQNDQELLEAEKKYLCPRQAPGAIILAASRGKELGDLTLNRPKALLEIQGRPILKDLIDKLNQKGIERISIVRGHKKEAFPDWGCTYIDNDDHENTEELHSLWLARDHIKGDWVFSYGDIIFRSFVLNLLEETTLDFTLVVDANIRPRRKNYRGDYVKCTQGRSVGLPSELPRLLKTQWDTVENLGFHPHGEWIGLLKVSEKGSRILLATLEEWVGKNPKKDSPGNKMGDLLNELIRKDVEIGVEYIDGHWMDIDTLLDFEEGQIF